MTAGALRSAAGGLVILAGALMVTATAVHAVVLPSEIAQTLERNVDAFIDVRGYQRLDVEPMFDDQWYSQFDAAGQSALPPDAGLDPVTRSVLLFLSQEAPLDTARYRITRHQDSMGGDWTDIRHSYIEITRYNLAPALHRANVAAYGEHAAPAGPEGQLPNVSWRLVTTGLMGQRAAVVGASRKVIDASDAEAVICFNQKPCLAPDDYEPDATKTFVAMAPPELAPAEYRTFRVDAESPESPEFTIASPARIAQELFFFATGEYDELQEAATLQTPEMVIEIGYGSGGQDLNSNALMHLTSLMDDATAEIWIKRLEVPGTVEWLKFDVPWPRGDAAVDGDASGDSH